MDVLEPRSACYPIAIMPHFAYRHLTDDTEEGACSPCVVSITITLVTTFDSQIDFFFWNEEH